MQQVKEKKLPLDTTAKKVFTTLDENTQPWKDTFTIFSKRANYDEPSKLPVSEQQELRKAIENLKLDNIEIRPWLYKAMKLQREGKKVLFLTDRLSVRTYKRSTYLNHPGLWDMVMCQYDMRHDWTKDVEEDYGEHISHDGSLDLWFRNRVYKSRMIMFIKVMLANPKLWEELESRDGQEVEVSYENDTLRLRFVETKTTYELAVGRIRLTPEK